MIPVLRETVTCQDSCGYLPGSQRRCPGGVLRQFVCICVGYGTRTYFSQSISVPSFINPFSNVAIKFNNTTMSLKTYGYLNVRLQLRPSGMYQHAKAGFL